MGKRIVAMGSHRSRGSPPRMGTRRGKFAYFLCEGPHKVRDCPKRNKLSTIAREKDDELDRDTLKLGSIILNSIKAKRFGKRKGLMFTKIMVASTKITALVDTGTFDLFVAERTAKRLDHEVSTMDVAQGVKLQLGDWKGKETIKEIPFDDYDFVVGLDFFDQINGILVPFANCLCIFDTQCQCIVAVR